MTVAENTDKTILLHTGGSSSLSSRLQEVAVNGVLGVVLISCSIGSMVTNKLLMDGGFPYAEVLVLSHAVCTVLFVGFLLLVFPCLFPALTDPMKRVDMNWEFLLRQAAPVALFLTALLVMNDVIYQYVSLAFVQMVKGGGVVLVYTLLVLVGMEIFKVRNALILLFIMAATALTVDGEISFSPFGLVLLLISIVLGAVLVVLAGRLLAGSGPKLDGFTYNLVIFGQQCVILGPIVVVGCMVRVPFVMIPSWNDVLAVRWLLLSNMFVAFLSNIASALFIKYCSPLAYVLVDTVKDAAVVLGSAAFFAQPLTLLQAFTFPAQLTLILFYSLMKTCPEAFVEGGQLAFMVPAMLRDPPPMHDSARSGSKHV